VRDKLYNYFTHKNTYRYVDVLSDFVSGYNARSTVRPANVTDSDIVALWKRMQKRRGKVRVKIVRYSVGQHVRIGKEKAKFAKSAKQNFSTEVFRIIKMLHRTPRPVYELEDLKRKVIDGQFCEEELTSVRITKQRHFQIDKILATRTRRGIKQHLVLWKGYNKDFDSWIPASDIQRI